MEGSVPPHRPRVVYLGGLGRSGSTLIERLLGELPRVCAAGEIVHLWQRSIVDGERCGCAQPFSDCQFWCQVGAAAFGGWDHVAASRVAGLRAAVDRNRHIPVLASPVLPPGFQRALREYLSYYLRLYRAIGQTAGSLAVIDSSKHASLAFCLRWCPDIDLRVVHVVRDSRAVAHSWAKQVSRPDSATESFMATYSPALSAVHWNTQNAALHLLARLGTPTLRVRYEDLVRAPGAMVCKIAKFGGLPAGGAALGFLGGNGSSAWADLHPAHTASGNPMRFATGRIAIRPDQSWRTSMPARNRRTVTALTLPLLAAYGYTREAA